MSAASKVCSGTCGRRLPLDAFHRKAASRDGRRNRCRDCTAAEAAEARRPNASPFHEAVRRVLDRRRREAAERYRRESDARLLGAVDGALEAAGRHALRPPNRTEEAKGSGR